MSDAVTLTHGDKTIPDITVSGPQAAAMLAGQKRQAAKRVAKGSPAVAAEWKPKKAGDA